MPGIEANYSKKEDRKHKKYNNQVNLNTQYSVFLRKKVDGLKEMCTNQYPNKCFNPLNKSAILSNCILLILFAGCGKNITNNDNLPSGDTFLLDKASVYHETDSSWVPGLTRFYTYEFDNKGRVTEKLESDLKDTYTTRYTYKYENSLLKEATLQRIKNPEKYYYKFNYSSNRLVNVEIRQDRTINYVNYYYTYDGDDTVKWTVQQTIPDTILYPMRPFCWIYEYHRLPGRRRLEIEGGRSTMYTYNSDNKLIKRTFYSGDTLSAVSYTLEYTYDDNGNVSEEIYTFDKKRVTRYTYKNYGKVKSAPMFFMTFF